MAGSERVELVVVAGDADAWQLGRPRATSPGLPFDWWHTDPCDQVTPQPAQGQRQEDQA